MNGPADKTLFRRICFRAYRIGFFCSLFCLLMTGIMHGQETLRAAKTFDSRLLSETPLDTARLLSDRPLKSPWGAVLRSALLPGWGQVYNKQYWKGALAVTVNGVLIWQIIDLDRRWEDEGSRSSRERRNLYSWYLGLTYLLTLIDAYVDANLYGFDKVIELGLRDAPGYGKIPLVAIQIPLRIPRDD